LDEMAPDLNPSIISEQINLLSPRKGIPKADLT
jgi:hypothetical protein